jgi:aminopeptidase N
MKTPRCLLALVAASCLGVTAHAQSIFAVSFDAGRSHPYDVLHTAIDVSFDEMHREVIGSVVHCVRVVADSVGGITLDADSTMRIASATANAASCAYALSGERLTITLPAAAHYGDTLELAISYRVAPTEGLYMLGPDSSNPARRHQIWTQGEAEEHHHWVPLYDFPNDRATTEMRITVPKEWKALSNGDLLERRANGDGTATWHYRLDRPHSSYLMMLAAGDYLVTRDTVDGMPLSYWSYPDAPDRVAPTFSETPDVMRFLVKRIGVPYPWSSYAQVVVSEFMYGGMENTSATMLTDDALINGAMRVDYDPAGLIAHEAAHQWFGDLVTARDWGHLWLQESFATFLASQYVGARYGEPALLNDMWEGGELALRSDSTTGRDPIAMGSGKVANLYQRGARVLYMLEKLVGEESFWRGVRLYLERNRYGNVETADFKNAMEDATGIELDWFFRQWIIGAGAPRLAVTHEYRDDSLRVVVRQTQRIDSLTGVFRMPLPIAAFLERGVVRDTVWLAHEADTFAIAVPAKPRYVVVDEGQTTLKRLEHQRTPEELAAQLAAPNMLDRWEAVASITRVDSVSRREPWRVRALATAYHREPTAEVRDAIVNGAGRLAGDGVAELVIEALRDSSIDVRVGAVDLMHRVADRSSRARLLRERLADSSTRVVAAAIENLAATDTVGLRATLAKWKGIDGRRGRMAQAWVDAVSAAQFDELVDDVAAYARAPYSKTTRWHAFIALRSLDRTTPRVRETILRGLSDASANVREAAADAARAHLDGELRAALTAMRSRLAAVDRERVDHILQAN